MLNAKFTTVNSLMEIKKFTSKVKLLNPEVDLARPITHITIMEAPDLYEWVEGGEFVLTTWYSMLNDQQMAIESFTKLAQKVSAIGIKTKRFIDEVPPEILAIADKYKLPVFEVKREVKFRELVTIIASQVQNYQFNMLVEAEEYNRKLVEVSASSDDIFSTLKAFYVETLESCICLDHEFEIVGNYGSLKNKIDLESIKRVIQDELFQEHGFFFSMAVDNAAVFACYAKKKLMGFLIVSSRCLKVERLKLICQQTALFLSIKLWNDFEISQRVLQKFWQDLISNRKIDLEDVKGKLHRFGIDLDHGATLGVVYHKSENGELFQLMDSYLQNKILLMQDNFIVVLYEKDKLVYKLSDFKNYIKGHENEYLAVMSPSFSSIENLRTYYKLSVDVIKILRALKVTGIKKMKDWAAYTMILYCKESPAYSVIKSSILEPLLTYDKEYHTQLIQSLCMSIILENLTRTAGKMHVHVNTLRYRLDKIKEITGKSFFITKDKHEMIVAMLIGQMEGSINFKVEEQG